MNNRKNLSAKTTCEIFWIWLLTVGSGKSKCFDSQDCNDRLGSLFQTTIFLFLILFLLNYTGLERTPSFETGIFTLGKVSLGPFPLEIHLPLRFFTSSAFVIFPYKSAYYSHCNKYLLYCILNEAYK